MPLNRIFALVGTAFGAVFVLVNAGGLPTPVAWSARAVGLLLVITDVWFGILRDRSRPDLLDRRSARTYWLAVAAEVVAIPVGAAVIGTALGRPELVVLWVVFVVGAHFLPARAFGIGRWAALGLVMMAIAVVFAVAALAFGPVWAAAGAVLAGLAMLGSVALPRPTTT